MRTFSYVKKVAVRRLIIHFAEAAKILVLIVILIVVKPVFGKD